MSGEFDPLMRCPRCGASTIHDADTGARWCSWIGGDTDAPCTWGLGESDRGSREADRKAWRQKHGIPDPCPAGHPAACLDAAGACRWCAEVARLTADVTRLAEASRVCDTPGCVAAVVRRDDGSRRCAAGHATRWVDAADLAALTESYAGYSAKAETRIAALEAEVAETRLRLAIWSGEGVPEGWEAEADGVPSIRRIVGRRAVRVGLEDGPYWEGWTVERDPLEDGAGCASALDALRAAEAWLKQQARKGRGRGAWLT